ncbi:peptidoglycan glycosyltransferase [Roseimicrobium gellanilyticum]|uniref:Peptidoglycan glycosyltransferase n=1 Tax=Roseimicrobium gellanilyticum TaxID=748857 RepID=A0A366HSI4_9BACT|nr:penicillin-binding protein 2 [Roseimicrobium gellanilyticum]RBP47232.1 peptidoglycan glycosyltransferase [Roseimicrobium gellanilyticum]
MRGPRLKFPLALLALISGPVSQVVAQQQLTLKALPAEPPPAESSAKKELKATWRTDKEARTLMLNVPAPRGQIVDRNGVPLAQTRVVQYLALSFPFLGEKAADREILEFAHTRLRKVNAALGKAWTMPDDRLLSHYKNRRWLPLVFTYQDNILEEVNGDQQLRLFDLLRPGSGVVLQAAYMRYYPKGACAPHIIGYTGRVRQLPTGPIQDGDPLFEEIEGRSGLEKTFDKDLQGRPGVTSVLFNPDGSKDAEEVQRRPMPGNNVVTSLDFNFQKYVENALAKHTRSGAMVIMDVKTGDVLAMGSFPMYDPNLFCPGITDVNYARLKMDKREPLFARAYQSTLPPASTFKIIVSQAALETGEITPRTAYYSGTSLWIGNQEFRNWSKEPEGSINVVTAIKRSTNTWFYQAALQIGAQPITDMAQRFGFGEKTGIPLEGEPTGFVPTDAWMMQKYGHRMQGGDIANLSIGQGRTLVTPLQVAQSMCGIADGNVMPQARLVKQVQDPQDRVLQPFPVTVRRRIALDPAARETVVKGMIAVVNASGGTGRNAQLDSKINIQVAGKTGTAQWVADNPRTDENDERQLAWFTGFLPANDPMYAFAVVYEGAPGETVGGGRIAAPIVSEVFENVYNNAPPDDPLVLLAHSKDAPKAIAISDEDEQTDGEASRPDGVDVPRQEFQPPPPPQQERRTVGGFFRKLFGRE